MKKIQVGFLMSYDYHLLKHSIPPVYQASDTIFIALDENYTTWTGGGFNVDPVFFDWLKEIDIDNKIHLYKDNFYNPNLSAMENEVRERHQLGLRMGIGNWLIQVDCDEYFLNFGKFVKELKEYDHFLENPEKNKIQICAFTLNLYKHLEQGILYVHEVRSQKFATNFPNYQTGRNTRERVIYTKHLLLHECVSRTEKEIREKFNNWGHATEVNTERFLQKWKAVDHSNYRNYQDFFYLEPEKWKNLNFIPGRTIGEINKNMDLESKMPSDFFIQKKNFGQWFKFLFK